MSNTGLLASCCTTGIVCLDAEMTKNAQRHSDPLATYDCITNLSQINIPATNRVCCALCLIGKVAVKTLKYLIGIFKDKHMVSHNI